jgi:hypothetical protein
MSINSTTSSIGASAAASTVSNAQGSETKKTSSDSSFKDEMDKVSSKEPSENKDNKKVSDEKATNKSEDKISEKNDIDTKNSDNEKKEYSGTTKNNDENLKFVSLSMNDANNMLTNDIQEMIITNVTEDVYNTDCKKDSGIINLDFSNSISMDEGDAQFFIDLAQNTTVTAQAVINQAHMALDNGAEISQVAKNVKISETLLNAINIARETNQPLRIDFDKNISVILRMGKDGSFAANFIPGNKAVEQYLKNNIELLKTTFDEKELPYTDLSYSNRGSKRQKEERNNQQ